MKIFLLLLCAMLSSCSKLDTAMKFADWLIIKETDSYFDLTDEQNKGLKKEIQKDLNRIRNENFPKMAKFLRQIATEAEANKVSPESMSFYQVDAQTIIKDALHQFQPTALDFALKASPEQIEHFKKKYQKETEKRKGDLETETDKFKMQKKRFEKWTDEWLGGLNSDQRKSLEADIKAFPFPWDLQINSRNYSLERFLAARTSRTTLQKYMEQLEDERSPDYEKALKSYQIHLKGFIFDLYKSLTAEQKKFFIQRLRDRAQEFETLSLEP